jgi:single-stranded-DNA-specific exonuclease
MDTPLTALRWLLAGEDRCDEFLSEIEELNIKRQEKVKTFTEKALIEANPDDGILFFVEENIEHGLIGLVAGKLTEMYNRPSIVLCVHDDTLVASCRSPEWCNLVELLDETKSFFIRYGGHRQAAGFSILASHFDEFRRAIESKFREKYDIVNLPGKTLKVECILSPTDITLENARLIETFRPFGIGNPKPLFLIENVTLSAVKWIGSEGKHASFFTQEVPGVKCLLWNALAFQDELIQGNIMSLIGEVEKNTWQ